MLGYKAEDVDRMIDILHYSLEDAQSNADDESAKWIGQTIDLLNGLLAEGHIE